jgi:hypothetical protein
VRHSSQTKLAPAEVSSSPLPPTTDKDAAASFRAPSPSSSELPLTASPPPVSGVLSFAELWPEDERHAVRHAEASLAAGDWSGAVLACDLLVARVLASGASLAGTVEAPRDPAVVAMLLGLSGPRYLSFRTTVRAARRREEVGARGAIDAYLFAVEARRARMDVE